LAALWSVCNLDDECFCWRAEIGDDELLPFVKEPVSVYYWRGGGGGGGGQTSARER